MSIQRGATVEFESRYTQGRWFTAVVVDVYDGFAIVKDIRDWWGTAVVRLSRLVYQLPTIKGMRK